jgi:hypothetical protein
MSERSQFDTVVLDVEGNALEDIEVTVYDADTLDEATIYSTKTGGGSAPNPFTTTANGLINFWANPGSYDINFNDTELPARITERTIQGSAIAGDTDDGGIDAAQLPQGTSAQIPIINSGGTQQLRTISGSITVTDTGGFTQKYFSVEGSATLPEDSSEVTVCQTTPVSGTYAVWGKSRLKVGGAATGGVLRMYKNFSEQDAAAATPDSTSIGMYVTLVVFRVITFNGTDVLSLNAGGALGDLAEYGRLFGLRLS